MSTLSDELLRELMAVGHVDVLVGIPTLNNASTIASVVTAVSAAFLKYFPRDRTVLLNSDGGSDDGTPALVREASFTDSETLLASHGLRTLHRVTAPYHGMPGKGTALRTIFAAADLLEAKTVAVVDPELANLTPDRVAALLRPTYGEQYDFVAPLYARHPLDGPLVVQLIRPVVRAVYGRALAEPLVGEFACSGRFAAHCLASEVWDSDLASYGIDLWLGATALTGGFRTGQVALGPRPAAGRAVRLGLPELFHQIVGSLFGCLDLFAPQWLAASAAGPLPTLGEAMASPEEPAGIDPVRMADSFGDDVRNLQPVLEQILDPVTAEEIARLAESPAAGLRFPDDLWARTVYEFAAAYHRAVIRREHVTMALVPLYRGRAAAFAAENLSRPLETVSEHLEVMCRTFERHRTYLVERWTAEVRGG